MGATLIVIPARLGSSRFPNKPLATIGHQPMLKWVLQHALKSTEADLTVLATCDAALGELAQECGVRTVMTRSDHERASDRTAEALQHLENEGMEVDHIVMLQGDEPTILPTDLDELIRFMRANPDAEVVNLAGPVESLQEFTNPNTIKVVADRRGHALYFSRAAIPHQDKSNFAAQKQVCAIGFTRQALLNYSELEEGNLETRESIDMNRLLEHGQTVHLVAIEHHTLPVDVPDDIHGVEQLLFALSGPEATT